MQITEGQSTWQLEILLVASKLISQFEDVASILLHEGKNRGNAPVA